MSIKNRIERLEKTSNMDSEFCACWREIATRVIYPDLDRTEEEYQELLAECNKTEYCDQCRKAIEHRIVTVRFVEYEDLRG